MTEQSAALRDLAAQHLARYHEACRDAGLAPVDGDRALAAQLSRILAASDYAARTCQRWPQLLHQLCAEQRLARAMGREDYAACLDEALGDCASEETLMQALRQVRHRELLRIAWRDLCGLCPLQATLAESSYLAEACIDAALQRLHAWHCERWGVPRDDTGQAQGLVVIGMGKLGAHELNFSSDVDLIFAFRSNGETDAGTPRANIEFFTRLGQRLIRVLSEPTVDGFAYRVDMRLRPFGESGPLVASGAALESYYLDQGREWERYAMIKARVVAGDRAAGASLLAALQPFVYRRYLDYGAFAALREVKDNIRREHGRRGRTFDVKLGDGGIRDIEFIGQAFQLIRGGREPRLQVRGILPALQRLCEAGHLPPEVVEPLSDAYRFLRRLENRLQMLDDEQIHRLPQGELDRERIALAMDEAGWDALQGSLRAHTEVVSAQFEAVFKPAREDQPEAGEEAILRDLWRRDPGGSAMREMLSQLGYGAVETVGQRLAGLRTSLQYKSLGQTARRRFDAVIPQVLIVCAQHTPADETLYRTLGLLQQVAGRSVYLVLLNEHPQALRQLASLFSRSPWIAGFVSQQPILLDELLDPRSLYEPPDREALVAELGAITAEIDSADEEAWLDRVRQFKHTNTLRIAAADIAGRLSLAEVSDRLTWLAEVILQCVYDYVWTLLCARHGQPRMRVDGEVRVPSLAVVAYGKLGGLELGYGSDLDLVFLHDSEGEQQHTDGARSLDNATFFMRFAQKLIHFLATRTAAGVLYEIDTRLRPNGNAGLLVSSIDAFATYQSSSAWTWEHQALVRARPVIAGAGLRERFTHSRAKVLAQLRERAALRDAIVAMREKMRSERGGGADPGARLKLAGGGITDIEFVVQYHVLAAAAEHPRLLDYPDNLRLLETLGELGLLEAEDAAALRDAYLGLRAGVHRLALGEQGVEEDPVLEQWRQRVSNVWQRTMLASDVGA